MLSSQPPHRFIAIPVFANHYGLLATIRSYLTLCQLQLLKLFLSHCCLSISHATSFKTEEVLIFTSNMAFHGPFSSVPHMCHPVVMPQGFAHQYLYSGINTSSFPCWNQPPPCQHPGLQNRIEFLETQLARVQQEKDSMHSVIKYLLADLGSSTRAKQSCPNCSILKFRLSLQSKATYRWKGKYREAATSLHAGKIRLRRLRNTVETATSISASRNSSSSGGDALVCGESPDDDLLGGTIPISITERFPASSSFDSDPLCADSPPELGKSENDQLSESEAESIDYATSANLSRLSVISTRQRCRKLAVLGDILPRDVDPSDFVVDSASKAELPYVRYFSGATVPTSTLSDAAGGIKEHVVNNATDTSLTDAISGPMSIAAGPRFSGALKNDDLPLPSSPGSARRTSPLTTTETSSESGDQILSGRIRWAVTDGIQSWKRWLFATEAERENAIAMNRRLAGREDVTFPDIFRYGIRYKPEPTAQNVYRTVLIEGLPGTVTLENVLKGVCGGSVLSTKLCDTYSITGSCSALITFVSESAACQYKTFAAAHAIFISGIAVKVSLLSTPTWPMSIPMRKAVFEHQHSRCLEVTNLPRHIDLCALQLDLRICTAMDCDMIEYLGVRGNGILDIRFSSINAAGQAYGVFTSRAKYRPCNVQFSPDPCVLQGHTLLEKGESVMSDEVSYVAGTFDDEMPGEEFADDEGVVEDDGHAEEDDADSLKRLSSSEINASLV